MQTDDRPERSTESPDAALARLARSQCSAFSRAQARELGFSEGQIKRRLASGRWAMLLPSVMEIAGAQRSGRQAAMAATLWAGQGSMVSHASAGVFWQFGGVRSHRVEVWTPRRLSSDLVVVHRGSRLDRADRTMLGPIPITTPIRTLIDISGRLEDAALAALVEDLITKGLVDPERLRARLTALRSSGRVGAGRLQAMLEQRGDGPAMESALEVLVWSRIIESGVPLPSRQHWVDVPGGHYRLDFCWPDLRLGLECDSYEHHGRRRDDWGKDRARYAELAVIGYRIMPVTWNVARHEPTRLLRWLRDGVRRSA
jgi:very-short-patch-repair endonuclease